MRRARLPPAPRRRRVLARCRAQRGVQITYLIYCAGAEGLRDVRRDLSGRARRGALWLGFARVCAAVPSRKIWSATELAADQVGCAGALPVSRGARAEPSSLACAAWRCWLRPAAVAGAGPEAVVLPPPLRGLRASPSPLPPGPVPHPLIRDPLMRPWLVPRLPWSGAVGVVAAVAGARAADRQARRF